MKARLRQALVGLVLLAGACGSEKAEDDAMSGMKGMDSAGGMPGMAMPGMQMMPGMRAHMDSMMGRSPAEMRETMARHQEMMSRMLDGMGTDMRGMNMTGDSAWPKERHRQGPKIGRPSFSLSAATGAEETMK